MQRIIAPVRGPHRYWTNREIGVLKKHYPEGGVPACEPLLPQRTDRSIHQQATKMGLRQPRGAGGFSYQRYTTTEHIDAVIRRAYEDPERKPGFVEKLAQTLNRPTWWVSRHAAKLGCTLPRRKDPDWSPAELELLDRLAGSSIVTIRRRLREAGFRRTESAIVTRLKRLGQPTGFDAGPDCYSAKALAPLLGVDHKAVLRWIHANDLKAKRRDAARRDAAPVEFVIHRRDVRAFVIANVGIIDLRRVDKWWFVEMLTT